MSFRDTNREVNILRKKNISKIQFQSVAGWRGDSLACPQAFGGDVFSGCSAGCWWCFCREMEEELFTKYYTGWHRNLVRPCNPDDFRKLFDKAFGTDKPSQNWLIRCLRRGIPFNLGSKAETFCIEDFDENVVVPILEIFKEYKVPLIIETKTHYVGLKRYIDLLKDMNVAIIVAIMGGSDTLNYELEPGVPVASSRWYLVKYLNEMGIWTGIRWEPVMIGINDKQEFFEKYAEQAIKSKARHVSIFGYRTSNTTIAKREFEKRGYDYEKFKNKNLLEGEIKAYGISFNNSWTKAGKQLFKALKKRGIKVSSPDFVNFPFDSDCESCCGIDNIPEFTPYKFTFQHACRLIKENGSVCWEDMERITFRESKSYKRMKEIWNGGGNYYSLASSPDIVRLGRDGKGMAIYGKKTLEQPHDREGGLLF